MLKEETRRRQNELKKYLLEMSSSSMEENELKKTAIQLKALYSSGFRHGYSEFFPLILSISENEGEYSLDFLSTNLEAVKELVENDYINGEKEFKGLYRPLAKLSDHINLEIGRYNYYSTSEQKVKDLEKKNKSLQEELKNATLDLKDAKNKMSSVQTELITVLSIFAAIVFTFSGSLNLIGNAFGEINKAPILKIALILLICGFIVFNMIFLMMYIVGKITGRSIYARCISNDCSCGENGRPKCVSINRFRKRLPYIFWINLVILILALIDIILWIVFSCNNIVLP